MCGKPHSLDAVLCAIPHTPTPDGHLAHLTDIFARRPGRRASALAACAVAFVAALVWGAGRLAEERALADVRRRAEAAAALHAAVLRSELEKHRSLPFALAEDPDVATVLRSGDPARARALSAKLEGLSLQTRASVIYALDRRGMTLSASNWRRPDTFVGSDYNFRPYFRDALTAGTAELFALGTVSRRPGLFLARRVDGPGGPLGVVVVKVEFDALEADWRDAGEPVFVTNRDGVVLVTSEPSWRFRVTGSESAVPLRSEGLQFGPGPLRRLPFDLPDRSGDLIELSEGPRMVAVAVRTSSPGWTLHLLSPAGPALGAAAGPARLAAFLFGAIVVFVAAWLLRRRRRAEAEAAAQEAARRVLETTVEERTRELRTSNRRLTVEIDERKRAEGDLQRLQDELVQSNKLAVLGQVAAGVAHEINQPVAAIRTYADNAAVLLDRDEGASARANLGRIAELTDRIGLITGELRAFARKSKGRPEPIRLADALHGAVLLASPRLRAQGITLDVHGDADLVVSAERVRLEQVFVNLLQNAAEALERRPDGRVRMDVRAARRSVTVTVSDNGPGLSPEVRASLFTPFTTSKPDGLGLGLVISRDIVAEFGGELELLDTPEGAAFRVTLKRAR